MMNPDSTAPIAPVRLAVEATALLGTRTGIGNFTAELIKELKCRADVEVSAFCIGRVGGNWLPDDVAGGIREVHSTSRSRVVRRLWRYLRFPSLERMAGEVDVVYGPNYIVPPTRRAAAVVSVHDVGFELDPPMAIPQVVGHRQTVRAAIRQGAWVHTDSEYVAAQVRDIYDVDPNRVVVVPAGVCLTAPGPHPRPGSPYVLALGSTDRRKDLTTLVEAFDQLASELGDLRLVLAGPDGDAADELNQAVADSPYNSRICRLGWVDEPTRSSLLHEAAAVAYPSLYEGFGLVPLEAMLAGVPVVTTSVASIPEVAGDAAFYVSPGSPDELAEALRQVLTDTAMALDLVARGRIRARAFTWHKSAEAMVGLFRLAADSR